MKTQGVLGLLNLQMGSSSLAYEHNLQCKTSMLFGIYNFCGNNFLVLDMNYTLNILRDLVGRDDIIEDFGMPWWSGDPIVEVSTVLNFQEFDEICFAGFREENLAEVDEYVGMAVKNDLASCLGLCDSETVKRVG